jgi:DNA-binding NtrC family response regulator
LHDESVFLVAKILLVGSDAALLEGLSQTLTGSGHHVCLASSLDEAADACRTGAPNIAVVSNEALTDPRAVALLPLSTAGALVVYTTEPTERPTLPTRLQRATLGHVVLPLERQRLIALIQHFEVRSLTTGRGRDGSLADQAEVDE